MNIIRGRKPHLSAAAERQIRDDLVPRILAAIGEHGPMPLGRVHYHLGYRDYPRIKVVLAELVAAGHLTVAVEPFPHTTCRGVTVTRPCRLYRLAGRETDPNP